MEQSTKYIWWPRWSSWLDDSMLLRWLTVWYTFLSILTIAKHCLHVCSSLPNEKIFSPSCPCCLGSLESCTLCWLFSSGFIRMISLHWAVAVSWLSLQSLLQPTEFMAPPHASHHPGSKHNVCLHKGIEGIFPAFWKCPWSCNAK